jgi:hypothetical protein
MNSNFAIMLQGMGVKQLDHYHGLRNKGYSKSLNSEDKKSFNKGVKHLTMKKIFVNYGTSPLTNDNRFNEKDYKLLLKVCKKELNHSASMPTKDEEMLFRIGNSQPVRWEHKTLLRTLKQNLEFKQIDMANDSMRAVCLNLISLAFLRTVQLPGRLEDLYRDEDNEDYDLIYKLEKQKWMTLNAKAFREMRIFTLKRMELDMEIGTDRLTQVIASNFNMLARPLAVFVKRVTIKMLEKRHFFSKFRDPEPVVNESAMLGVILQIFGEKSRWSNDPDWILSKLIFKRAYGKMRIIHAWDVEAEKVEDIGKGNDSISVDSGLPPVKIYTQLVEQQKKGPPQNKMNSMFKVSLWLSESLFEQNREGD